ncbi:MAG TPA: MaoC family dehydratase [Candidatus Binataceae bacterium]|nr:MaoC family dehydratase [Candidatus Binataceae bacterium]
MNTETENLRAGERFTSQLYLLDAAAAEAYGKSIEEPPRRRRKNIHTDNAAATQAGFAAPIAAGEQTIAVAAQLLVDRFGMRFLRGGRIEVALVKPVFYGDSLVASAEVERAGAERIELKLSVANQRGEQVLTGTAQARAR